MSDLLLSTWQGGARTRPALLPASLLHAPSDFTGHLERAEAFALLGRYDRMTVHLRSALELGPQTVFDWGRLIRLLPSVTEFMVDVSFKDAIQRAIELD